MQFFYFITRFRNFKRVFFETKFFQFAYIRTRKIISVHSQNWCRFTLRKYAEHEHTVEIIALIKVFFFNAKSCKKMVRNGTFSKHQNISKKIKFLSLMVNFTFMFLEIILIMEKIELRWFKVKIATSRGYANC